MKNVLVLPSGTELGLEIFDALSRRRDIKLFGAESTENSHASYVFRRNTLIPAFDDSRFIAAVQNAVAADDIDYVYPAHDDVQLALLQDECPLTSLVVSSPKQTVEITRFKSRTYDAMHGVVAVPKLFDAATISRSEFPVFVKPNRGQGSQNVHLCSNRAELDVTLSGGIDMLICEYLQGREVTVDCFSDREQGLLFADARVRKRTRSGISVHAEPCTASPAFELAQKISSCLQFYGPWFFQIKERSADDWVLLEIGARIPGGTTYQRMRGVNMALLGIFEHERLPINICPNNSLLSMDRAFVSRFKFDVSYSTIYVDFDDTIALKDEPNADLLGLIALARHRGKRAVLLSRNDGNCREWLARHGLTALFDELVLLDRRVAKSAFIESDGILIDDSFAERRECQRAGIACFDVDAGIALLEQLKRN